MSSHDPKRTDTDFNIAFNGLLASAREHGVNTREEANRAFIQQCAESVAEAHAHQRWLYGFIHMPKTENSHECTDTDNS